MNDPGDEHADLVRDERAEHAREEHARTIRTLRRFADSFAAAYGGPVYLVGSAIEACWVGMGYLHDVDIRCVIKPHDWSRLFGEREIRNGDIYQHTTQDIACMREQLKQSRRLSRALGFRVDFQFQHPTTFDQQKYAGRPRLRLDTLPDEVFDAGLGDT